MGLGFRVCGFRGLGVYGFKDLRFRVLSRSECGILGVTWRSDKLGCLAGLLLDSAFVLYVGMAP